jgi:Protein of unknown function (DUF3084)
VDFLSIGFLLLIVVVSGGIAYLADNLGRKLGKKRLTIFGLRPRHTAALGVILTGVFVSLLTILFVGIVSYDVRSWLLHGRQAIQQLKLADAELKRLQTQQTDLTRANVQLTADNALKVRQRAEQDKIIETRRKEILALTQKVEAGSARIKVLDAKLSANDQQLRDRQRQLASAQRLLADVRHKIVVAQQTRNEAVRQSNEVKTRNVQLESENGSLETKVAGLKGDVEKINREMTDLTKARDEIQKALLTAQQSLLESQEKLASTESKLSDTERDLLKLAAQYKLDSEFYQALSQTFEKSRFNPLEFKMGVEIARQPLPAGMTGVQAANALDSFIRLVRAEATKRGAKASGKYLEADIVDHTDRTTGATITSQEIKNRLVRDLLKASTDVVVVAYSSLNAFAGEPVSLELAIFPNPPVYRAGQILAETKVNGKKTAPEIFAIVSDFVGTKVKARAEQDKMLPRVGADVQFGSISSADILDLVNRIRDADRTVTVRAVADVDTRAGDELRLRFSLR